MKTPILETERLILRPVTLEDAPAIQKYFNNWNIIKHLTLRVPWPYPEDGAETIIRQEMLPKIEQERAFIWAITLRENISECIGIIAFENAKDPQGERRGFWLAEHLHGRGYMTETVTVVQDFLFFEAGVERFIVNNAITNKQSRRIKEKTGAVFIGTVENPHHSGDNISEIWEMTRENWEKFRGKR